MNFENATPRPWALDEVKTASGLAYRIGAGEMLEAGRGCCIIYDDYPATISRRRANAELIVTAVNAHDGLMNAAQAAVYALKSYEYGNSSPELAQEVIVALEAALKLARAEK